MTHRYALSLLSVFALTLCLSAESIAQQRQAPEAITVEVTPLPERGDDDITLRYFNPDATATIFWLEGGTDGFVFGTNIYGDLGKAVAFELPTGMDAVEILRVNAWMFTSGSAIMEEYDAVVWSGTALTGPQDDLGRQTFSIFDVAGQSGPTTNVAATVHQFDDPIVVDQDFFVGFQWGDDHDVTDLGMVSSAQLTAPSPYEWEQWDDEGWRNLATAWGFNGAHVWIEVVVREVTVSSEGGAQPQEIVLSSVFPNPVAASAQVELNVASPQQVDVQIYNMLGQRVATAFQGMAPAGSSRVAIDGAELAPGMYVVRVLGEDFSMSRKFVVAR